MLITDTRALVDFLGRLEGAPYVAIDTEFLREKTYWPKLCLVQLAFGEDAAAIDALAPGIDLAPLFGLLDDRDVLKVFHSAAQDMEVFWKVAGRLPAPIFDTQVAAMVCGFGEQAGYATLASRLAGADLDKASQLTDWSLRPLSSRQIKYALSDVTHLCTIYDKLSAQVGENGRATWVSEEMAALTSEDRYLAEPREAWRRIRIRRPSRRALAVLREVGAWRERKAQQRDLPRNWVLRDEALVEIATHSPRTVKDLERVRGLSAAAARGRDGQALLAAVGEALALSEDQWPELPPRRAPVRGHETLVALLQALLRLRCEAQGVAPRLVATRDELELLAVLDDPSDEPDLRLLKGWRRDLFGDDALALKDGRLALTGEGPGVREVRVGN